MLRGRIGIQLPLLVCLSLLEIAKAHETIVAVTTPSNRRWASTSTAPSLRGADEEQGCCECSAAAPARALAEVCAGVEEPIFIVMVVTTLTFGFCLGAITFWLCLPRQTSVAPAPVVAPKVVLCESEAQTPPQVLAELGVGPQLPVDLVCCLDSSASVGKNAFLQSRDFVQDIVKKLEMPNCSVGVVAFHHEIIESETLHLTDEKEKVVAHLEGLSFEAGETRLAKPIRLATGMLTSHERPKHHRKVILLVTDGDPNDPADAKKAADNLRGLGVELFIVQAGDADNPRATCDLATSSNRSQLLLQLKSYDVLPNYVSEVCQRLLDFSMYVRRAKVAVNLTCYKEVRNLKAEQGSELMVAGWEAAGDSAWNWEGHSDNVIYDHKTRPWDISLAEPLPPAYPPPSLKTTIAPSTSWGCDKRHSEVALAPTKASDCQTDRAFDCQTQTEPLILAELGVGEQLPVDLVFCLDSSSSVGEHTFSTYVRFVMGIVQKLEMPNSSVGVVAFHHDIIECQRLDLTDDKDKVVKHLDSLSYTAGETKLAKPIRRAVGMLTSDKRPETRVLSKHHRKVILVVTDGDPNDPAEARQAAEHAKGQEVEIFMVQAGTPENPAATRTLATTSKRCKLLHELQKYDLLMDAVPEVLQKLLDVSLYVRRAKCAINLADYMYKEVRNVKAEEGFDLVIPGWEAAGEDSWNWKYHADKVTYDPTTKPWDPTLPFPYAPHCPPYPLSLDALMKPDQSALTESSSHHESTQTESSYDALTKKCDSLQTENKELSTELASLKKEMKGRVSLQTDVSSLSTELASLKKELKGRDSLLAENSTLSAELASLKIELEGRDSLLTQNSALSAQLASLKKELKGPAAPEPPPKNGGGSHHHSAQTESGFSSRDQSASAETQTPPQVLAELAVGEQVPVDIVCCLDSSASVGCDGFDKSVCFFRHLLEELEMPNSNAGLLTFHHAHKVVSELTGDKGLLLEGLRNLRFEPGETNLAPPLRCAAEMLKHPDRCQGCEPACKRRKIILVVTDGDPNDLREATKAAAELKDVCGLELFFVLVGKALNVQTFSALASTSLDGDVSMHQLRSFDQLPGSSWAVLEKMLKVSLYIRRAKYVVELSSYDDDNDLVNDDKRIDIPGWQAPGWRRVADMSVEEGYDIMIPGWSAVDKDSWSWKPGSGKVLPDSKIKPWPGPSEHASPIQRPPGEAGPMPARSPTVTSTEVQAQSHPAGPTPAPDLAGPMPSSLKVTSMDVEAQSPRQAGPTPAADSAGPMPSSPKVTSREVEAQSPRQAGPTPAGDSGGLENVYFKLDSFPPSMVAMSDLPALFSAQLDCIKLLDTSGNEEVCSTGSTDNFQMQQGALNEFERRLELLRQRKPAHLSLVPGSEQRQNSEMGRQV